MPVAREDPRGRRGGGGGKVGPVRDVVPVLHVAVVIIAGLGRDSIEQHVSSF